MVQPESNSRPPTLQPNAQPTDRATGAQLVAMHSGKKKEY